MDVKTAQQIVHELYPSAESITMVEHGYDNIVALVDYMYAVRFPRDQNAYARSQYEKHILKHLEMVDTITIPRILSDHANPPYLVTSFVSGRHVSSKDIASLPMQQQRAFGKMVAQFAYAMHTTLILEDELKIRRELKLDNLTDEPWPLHFEKTTLEFPFPTPQQDAIAKKYYALWNEICNVDPQVVVHDDLHTENMFFDNNNYLVGILDFGDTNVGTPEQELRQLYRISEEVLLAAVYEYETVSGKALSIKAIKTWAVTQELATYSEKLAKGETGHPVFKRACRNLNAWLREGEWGKGYDISPSEGYL